MRRVLNVLALLALAAVCVWAAPGAVADDKPGASGDKFKNISDADFAREASAGGLAEVNLGRIGVQRAVNPEVRKFAQRMVDGHGKANQELITLANKKGMTLARAMDQEHQQLADRLMKMSGEEFDRTFMKHMLKDHKDAVALFEAEANKTQDADLKQFASRTLPTLREHLRMARELAGEKEPAGGGTRDKDKVIKP
jgi:putative membrane protein